MRATVGILMMALIAEAAIITEEKREAMKEAQLSPEEYERVHNLHLHWYIRAVNSLMGAVGREMFLKMRRSERSAFIQCLDTIPHDHDLQAGAQCLVHAWDRTLPHAELEKPLAPEPKKNEHQMMGIVIKRLPPKAKMSKRLEKLKKRVDGIQLPSYAMDHRNGIKSGVRSRLKRSNSRLYGDGDKKEKSEYLEMFADSKPKTMATAPDLIGGPKIDPPSPVRQLTNMFTNLLHAADPNNARIAPWKHSYSQLKKLNEAISQSHKEKDFRHRMLDVVTDNDAKYRKKIPFMQRFRQFVPERENMPKMMKGAYELVDVLNAHTDKLNAKILSPRIGSIVDTHRDKDTFHFLSPNILPFYKDDSPNSIMPLPDLMDAAGLRADDKDAILELVMEVSGANEVVQDAFKIFQNNQTAALMNDIDGVTETLDAIYDQVKQMFDRKQRKDLAQRKYTFLSGDQAEMLYGEKGPFSDQLNIDLQEYRQWTEVDKRRALMRSIRRLADGKASPEEVMADSLPQRKGRRKKRGLTTLAPFSFSPSILSPAFLGPSTLSPNLFSPSIISPTALSPPVLTPSVGSPLIISPYVFSPNTISPAVFEVYILSPYCIAPNVINPYVMSPIILSPHVLSPDVMSPTILSGAILNPYVLGPAILTESALAADVLSPSLLSRKRRKRSLRKLNELLRPT